MTVVEVSSLEGLNTILTSNDQVVVDFAAPAWCVPCQRLAPHYEKVAEKSENGTVFVSVDIDTADADLVGSYQIQSVPTVLAFKAGQPVGPVEGKTGPKIIKELDALFKE